MQVMQHTHIHRYVLCTIFFQWQDNKDNSHVICVWRTPRTTYNKENTPHNSVYEWNEYLLRKCVILNFGSAAGGVGGRLMNSSKKDRQSSGNTWDICKIISSQLVISKKKISEKMNMKWVCWKWMEAFNILGMDILHLFTFFLCASEIPIWIPGIEYPVDKVLLLSAL